MSGVDAIANTITPPARPARGEGPVATSPQNTAVSTPQATVQQVASVRAQTDNSPKLLTSDTNLQIIRDDKSGRYVYKFIDPQTGKVKGQFPQEYVLRELAYLREQNGKVVNATA